MTEIDARNNVIEGNIFKIVKNLKPKSISTMFFSSPYFRLRSYNPKDKITGLYLIEHTMFGGDPACKHEWNYYLDKGTTGGTNSPKVNTKGTDNFQIVGNSEFAFCNKCKCWLGDFGREMEPSQFVMHLCDLCDALFPALKDWGTIMVNLGESYAGSGGSNNYKEEYGGSPIESDEVEDRSIISIPHMFVSEMVKRGWICRNDIIWRKENVMPHPDPTKSSPQHEYLFLLTKSNKPKFWANTKTLSVVGTKPLGSKGVENIDWNWKKNDAGKLYKRTNWRTFNYFYNQQFDPRKFPNASGIPFGGTSKQEDFKKDNPLYSGNLYAADRDKNTRSVWDFKDTWNCIMEIASNMPDLTENQLSFIINILRQSIVEGDVWDINTQQLKEAHFASFPTKLAERVIDMLCPTNICTKCGLPVVPLYFKTDTNTEWMESCGADRNGEYVGQGQKEYKANGVQNPSDVKRRILKSLSSKIVKYAKCNCNAKFEKGLVFDPFLGSGTTFMVAKKLKRDGGGCEINPEYVKIAWSRIKRYWNPDGLW